MLIKLTDETLLSLATNLNNDEIMTHYYELAVNNKITSDKPDSLVKFYFALFGYFENKLFCKKSIDPLDFFGMKKHDENSDYVKYLYLLDRMNYEILININNDIFIPPHILEEFYGKYAHALYIFGYYYKCLEFCQKALDINSHSSLSTFLKSSVIEICYINKHDYITNAALFNYQKQLINICDPSKVRVSKEIFNEVHDIIISRTESMAPLFQAINFVRAKNTFKETQKVQHNWTREKDFYLRNKLFLNPLNMFDNFTAASNEEFPDFDISNNNKKYCKSLIDDYNMCRHKLYSFYRQPSRYSKNEISMLYSYIYSIFDKLAFLLKKIYNLDIDDGKVEFKSFLFDKKLKNTNIKFKEITNDNIWPLFLIMQEVKENRKLTILRSSTYGHNKLRNKIEHRSVSLTEKDELKDKSLHLLKLSRDAILHAFALIETCPKKYAVDKATMMGTTFQWAGKRIFDKAQKLTTQEHT